MPFKSAAQMRYLHAKEPEVAAKWDKETKKEGKSFPKGDKKMASGKTYTHGSGPKGKPVDVGAAKGNAQAGADTSDNMLKEGMNKGPAGGKPEAAPEGSNNDAGMLAQRGMSSEEAAKHWSGNVPKNQSEHRVGKKK